MRRFYIFYYDATRIAFQSIFAHKLRAFLTLSGVIIAVASVVLVGAAIDGLNLYMIDRITRILGANHFLIARIAHTGRLSQEEYERMDRRNKRLDWDDLEWVRLNCIRCSEVGAQASIQIDLKHNGLEIFGAQINGITANMIDIEDKLIAEGRFILQHEVEHGARVCVIGAEIQEKFFVGSDPIGKEIKINDMAMTIVGVEQKRGSMFGRSLDNHVYLPLTTYQRLFGRGQSLQLHGKAPNLQDLSGAIEQARISMRNRHRLKANDEDDFGLINVADVNSEVDEFTNNITMVITPITLISLLVGAIVVMNIMLVSVTERTYEIGLRKALGATHSHIRIQFLIESSILTSLGGVLGLLLASFAAQLIKVASPIPLTITAVYVLMSLAVSGAIGLAAGIYPAVKAARLDPISALSKA